MRIIQFILVVAGILLLVIAGILHFTRTDSNGAYQLVFTADVLSQGPQLYTANLDGSNVQQISFNANHDQSWLSCPTPSPDGRWIGAYSIYSAEEIVYSIRTRWGSDVVEFSHSYNGYFCDGITWVNGWFYYSQDRTLYRVHPQRVDQPEVVGQGSMAISSITPSPDEQWLFYPVNDDAGIMFHTQQQRFIDFAGAGDCIKAVWSPDSRYLICATHNAELLLLDVQAVTGLFLTAGSYPAWSPDAQWIAFWDERELFRIQPDGSARESLLTLPEDLEFNQWSDSTPIWDPHGEWLLLPNLCSPGGIASDCDTYRFTLVDSTLIPVRPIQHLTSSDGKTEDLSIHLSDARLLPPLKADDFNALPLLVVGALMVIVGLAPVLSLIYREQRRSDSHRV